jgi:hypothetical protein
LLSLQTQSSDARPKKYRGQKNKIKIFLSIQTEETSNARPSSLKKYRGEKNKINILLYIQTKSSDGRLLNPKKVYGKKIRFIYYFILGGFLPYPQDSKSPQSPPGFPNNHSTRENPDW